MTPTEKQRSKDILFACAEMLTKLELQMTIEQAQTLIRVHDGIGSVHAMLSAAPVPEKAEKEKKGT